MISICAYKDLSGIFTSKWEDVRDLTGSGSSFGSSLGYMKAEPHMKIEDEEDLLYGESGSALKLNSVSITHRFSKQFSKKKKTSQMIEIAKRSKDAKSDWWRRMLQQPKPTYWLIVSRESGNLEIYSMPDLKLMYLVNNVGVGNSVLTDSMEFVPLNVNNQENSKLGIVTNCMPQANCPSAIEIAVFGLGYQGNRPILLIRTKHEVLIYQAFRYAKGNLKLRFKKLNTLNVLDTSEPMEHEDLEMYDSYQMQEQYVNKIRYFGESFLEIFLKIYL